MDTIFWWTGAILWGGIAFELAVVVVIAIVIKCADWLDNRRLTKTTSQPTSADRSEIEYVYLNLDTAEVVDSHSTLAHQLRQAGGGQLHYIDDFNNGRILITGTSTATEFNPSAITVDVYPD